MPILPEGGARASKINNRLQYLFSLSFSLVIEEEIEHYNSVYETLPRLITQNVLQPKRVQHGEGTWQPGQRTNRFTPSELLLRRRGTCWSFAR